MQGGREKKQYNLGNEIDQKLGTYPSVLASLLSSWPLLPFSVLDSVVDFIIRKRVALPAHTHTGNCSTRPHVHGEHFHLCSSFDICTTIHAAPHRRRAKSLMFPELRSDVCLTESIAEPHRCVVVMCFSNYCEHSVLIALLYKVTSVPSVTSQFNFFPPSGQKWNLRN